MWKDRGSAEWCSTEWRGRKDRKGGRRRKGGILEIKSSGEKGEEG